MCSAACVHQVAKLDRVMAGSSLMVGDVLRGVTCTNFVYPTQALFGVQAPRRTIVLYGADNQKWPQARAPSSLGQMHAAMQGPC